MRRYLLETSATDSDTTQRAPATAAQRYPEVIIEASYVPLDDATANGVWICLAPTERHVRRWATAAHLDVRRLTPIIHLTPQGRDRGTR